MKTLSNQQIWTAFVKRVTARGCNDPSHIAQRLHRGHDLIFRKSKMSSDRDEIKELAKKITSVHKNEIWNACLENAKNSEKDSENVAIALVRTYHLVFEDKATGQDLHSRQDTHPNPHHLSILTIGISDKDH